MQKTKLLLPLLLMLFSVNSFGYHYYYYSKDKLTLSKAMYNRYAMPQLKTLDQEFYSLLRRSFEGIDGPINLKRTIANMNKRWNSDIQYCLEETHNQKKCMDLFKDLKNDSLRLEKKFAEFQNKNLFKKNNIIELIDNIDNLEMTNFKLQHALEISTANFQSENTRNAVKNIFTTLQFYSEKMMIDFISPEFKPLYENLWLGFFKPLEEHIIPADDDNYLRDNMGEMNFAWSGFHNKMERGNFNVDKKLLNSISTMRSRWNQILKLYLRNTNFVPDNKIKPTTIGN